VSDEITPQRVFDEHHAAPYIGFSAAALRAWRRQGRGPAYIQVGRSIRYRLNDLDSWLAAHEVRTREPR